MIEKYKKTSSHVWGFYFFSGYTGNGTAGHCSDINECDITPCHQQATCNNSPGTYSCECNNGFSGNGTYCAGMGLTSIYSLIKIHIMRMVYH